MKKVFPAMMNCLGTGHVICILAYWFIAFVLFPLWMPWIGYGLWEDYTAISWVECVYHGINSAVMILVLKEHLGDMFFELRYNTKKILKTVRVACELMIAYGLVCYLLLNPVMVMDVFPVAEMGVALTPGFLVDNNPIVGTVCLSLLVPFGVCGLFYATGFAPVCCRVPKLAYLSVAFLIFLPTAFDLFWRGDMIYALPSYVLQLPVHLIACWSYQRTDNIWTPIISLGIFNLLASVVCIIF